MPAYELFMLAIGDGHDPRLLDFFSLKARIQHESEDEGMPIGQAVFQMSEECLWLQVANWNPMVFGDFVAAGGLECIFRWLQPQHPRVFVIRPHHFRADARLA